MEWVQVAQTLGVASACLFALAIGVWRVAKWVAANLLIPVRDGHLSFLKSVGKSVDVQTKSLESIADSLASVGASRAAEVERLDHIATKLEEITATMDRQIGQLVVKTGSVVVVPLPQGPHT